VADYAGSRRAAPAAGALEERPAGAEPDAALTCPQCGSFVRADQQWCTLCLHVLHAPEPEPEPQPEPEVAEQVAEPVTVADAATGTATAGAATGPTPSGLTPEAEAAAQALLEQLAVETRRDSFQVPSFLRSPGQKAVAVAVVMSVLSTLVIVTMDIAGAILH
jgi:hypothetical protein